jgi:hypothetical protein
MKQKYEHTMQCKNTSSIKNEAARNQFVFVCRSYNLPEKIPMIRGGW